MAAATLPMNALSSIPRPRISSPLAATPSSPAATLPARPAHPKLASRSPSFPVSRPLRPFAAIGHVSKANTTKPVKIIEPPVNQRGHFVLNLTQAELCRRD